SASELALGAVNSEVLHGSGGKKGTSINGTSLAPSNASTASGSLSQHYYNEGSLISSVILDALLLSAVLKPSVAAIDGLALIGSSEEGKMSWTVADAVDYKGYPADRSKTGGWVPATLILGMSMIIYGLRIIKVWLEEREHIPPTFEFLCETWFAYTLICTAIFMCVVTCLGHMAADSMNGYCFSCEGVVTADIPLNSDWEK
ncbi:hypothetical protein S83_055197, partial [Arachis hypogaea]